MTKRPWMSYRPEDQIYRDAALTRLFELAIEFQQQLGPGGMARMVDLGAGGGHLCEGYFRGALRGRYSHDALPADRIEAEVRLVRDVAEGRLTRTPSTYVAAGSKGARNLANLVRESADRIEHVGSPDGDCPAGCIACALDGAAKAQAPFDRPRTMTPRPAKGARQEK